MSQSNRPNILKTLVKWRLWILMITLAVVLAGVFYAMKMETLYKAQSLIQVELPQTPNSSSSQTNLAEERASARQYVLTQLERLRSRSVAEPVVTTLNLQNEIEFADQSLAPDRRIDQAVTRLTDHVNIFRVSGTNLITIETIDSVSSRAADISNLMAETFIEITQQEKAASPEALNAALRNRLVTYREQLEAAERDLAEFADEAGLELRRDLRGIRQTPNAVRPGQGADYLDLSQEHLQAQMEATELRQRYRQANDTQMTREFRESEVLVELQARKRDLEAEYQRNLANLKPGFPLMKELQADITILDEQIREESETILAMIRADRDRAIEIEASLKERVEANEEDLRSSLSNNVDYAVLQRAVDSQRAQYEAVLERLVEVAAVNGIAVTDITLVDRAITPNRPFQPNWPVTLFGSFLIGLVSALLLVFTIENVDDKVKTPQDIEVRLGLPLLGVVPAMPKKKMSMETLSDPQSSLSEAVFSIRTNLLAKFDEFQSIVLHVTSTRPDEGKSVTVFMLAKSFADLNIRTLILDGDMRKPTFTSENLGERGLMAVLQNSADVSAHIVTTRIPNLYLLPCGEKPNNPSAILGGPEFQAVLARLRRDFDMILIDAPPVLGLADSPTIGAMSDYSIYLVQHDAIRVSNLRASLNRLLASQSNLLGIVLTKYTATLGSYADSYYYSYGKESQNYGKETEKRSLIARILGRKPKRKRLDIL